MGGGVSASRHYCVENTDKSIDIEIVTDSPLLQSMLMFFTNPAFAAAQPGAKLVKIKGHKAIEKFSAQQRQVGLFSSPPGEIVCEDARIPKDSILG